MSITISDIEQDIAGYRARIQKAQSQLDGLPCGYLPYQLHKKREKIRKDCEGEVEHVKRLIRYAEQGIKIRKGEIENGCTQHGEFVV